MFLSLEFTKLGEVAKKVIFLVARPLRGGGGGKGRATTWYFNKMVSKFTLRTDTDTALMAGPLKKEPFLRLP